MIPKRHSIFDPRSSPLHKKLLISDVSDFYSYQVVKVLIYDDQDNIIALDHPSSYQVPLSSMPAAGA